MKNKWSIKFDSPGCLNDGDSSQYNFTIEKPTKYEYKITNNANVKRTYEVTIKK